MNVGKFDMFAQRIAILRDRVSAAGAITGARQIAKEARQKSIQRSGRLAPDEVRG